MAIAPTIEFTTAEEMRDALRPQAIVARLAADPRTPGAAGGKPREWLFRGLDDAGHRLIPAAWRPSKPWMQALREGDQLDVSPHPAALAPAARTVAQQDALERAILARTYAYGDLAAIDLPGDIGPLRRLIKDTARGAAGAPVDVWAQPEYLEFAAAAQHYCVPTRLMDWSRKPFVAEWFAASVAARNYASDPKACQQKRLAVWALRYRNGTSGLDAGTPYETYGASVFSVGRGRNANLHLQSGLFSLHRAAPHGASEPADDALFNPLPLDEVLAPHAGLFPMVKMTLPWSEAGRLLALLADDFTQGATLLAGWPGVLASLEALAYRG